MVNPSLPAMQAPRTLGWFQFLSSGLALRFKIFYYSSDDKVVADIVIGWR